MTLTAKQRKRFLLDWRTEVAECFEVTQETVANWEQAGMPVVKLAKPRKSSGRGRAGKSLRTVYQQYPLDRIAAWLIHHGPYVRRNGSERELVGGDQNPDAWMSAQKGTPEQRRGWLAKAELLELELAQRRNQLCPVAEMRETLQSLASVIQRLGERLGREYGRGAAEAVNESLVEFAKIVDDKLRSSPRPLSVDGGTVPNQGQPSDQPVGGGVSGDSHGEVPRGAVPPLEAPGQ